MSGCWLSPGAGERNKEHIVATHPRAQRGTHQTPVADFMGHKIAEARAKLGRGRGGRGGLTGEDLAWILRGVGICQKEGRVGVEGGSRETELHRAVGRKSQMVCLGSREPLGVVGRRPGCGWESPAERSANVDSCYSLQTY